MWTTISAVITPTSSHQDIRIRSNFVSAFSTPTCSHQDTRIHSNFVSAVSTHHVHTRIQRHIPTLYRRQLVPQHFHTRIQGYTPSVSIPTRSYQDTLQLCTSSQYPNMFTLGQRYEQYNILLISLHQDTLQLFTGSQYPNMFIHLQYSSILAFQIYSEPGHLD